MKELSRASIEPAKIVSFLKSDMQLKDVCQKILYQKVIEQAAEERELTVAPDEIQAECDRIRREQRLEKASDTLAWLADRMITVDDLESGIRDRLLAKKLSNCLFAKDVEKFFAENRLHFEQILLYQIITADEVVAKEILYQIEDKEVSFYEAAHLYDIDEKRRQQCGFEGKLERWKIKQDIASVVFNAKIGEVIGPVATNQGYHLLMVEEFIPAKLTPESYQDILDKMFNEWLASELNYMLHSQTC